MQVAAAALHLHCRLERLPWSLLDFSTAIGMTVFKLGDIHKDLCEIITQHNPMIVIRYASLQQEQIQVLPAFSAISLPSCYQK